MRVETVEFVVRNVDGEKQKNEDGELSQDIAAFSQYSSAQDFCSPCQIVVKRITVVTEEVICA